MMDITPFTIYWITRLDGIIDVLSVCTVILLIVAISAGLAGAMLNIDSPFDDQLKRTFKRILYGCGVACIICGLGAFLTPSTKTAAAMYVVPRIVRNEKIQGTASSLYDLAAKWLRETHSEK